MAKTASTTGAPPATGSGKGKGATPEEPAKKPRKKASEQPAKSRSLGARMTAVMAGVYRLGKSGYNKHHGYAFATDGDVSDLIRTLLAEHGIAFWIELAEIVSREQHGKQMRMVIRWTITLENADDPGDVRGVNWISEALDTQDKAINKAATAAVKYFLLKTFLVSTGEEQAPASDGDTDNERGEDVRPRKQPPRPPGVTEQQLATMRGLVDQGGGTWEQFTEFVKGSTNGGTPEAMPRDIAELWIKRLRDRAAQIEQQRLPPQQPPEPGIDQNTGEGGEPAAGGQGEQAGFDYGPPPYSEEEPADMDGEPPGDPAPGSGNPRRGDTSRNRRNPRDGHQ